MIDVIVWIMWNKIQDLIMVTELLAIFIGVLLIIFGIKDNTLIDKENYYIPKNVIEKSLLVFKKIMYRYYHKDVVFTNQLSYVGWKYKILFGKKYFIGLFDYSSYPPEHINCRCMDKPINKEISK